MPHPARADSAIRTFTTRVLPPLVVLGAVIGIWYYISYVPLDENDRILLLPPPHVAIQEGVFTWKAFEEILEGLWATTVVTVTGLTISIVFGVATAVFMSRARWIERTLFPYAVALQAVPIIAITPIIGMWLGFAFNARVLVTVVISIFPIITNTLFGLQSVDRNHHDLFTLHDAPARTRLWRLELPSAIPAMFAGLRIASALAVTGAIVGEFFFRGGTQKGIGRLISVYQVQLQIDLLIAAIIFSTILGVSIFLVVGALGNRVMRDWHESVGST